MVAAACGANPAPAAIAPRVAPAPVPPSDARPDATANTDPLVAEQDALALAKPVFKKYCVRCHMYGANDKAFKKLDANTGLDTIDATKVDKIRVVLGGADKPPTMPKDRPGEVKGDELALVMNWTDAYSRAQKAGAK